MKKLLPLLLLFTFFFSHAQDQDSDGVPDTEDFCPDTPASQQVNEFGCSVNQLTDLVIDNIRLGVGADPCAETRSNFITIEVLQDVVAFDLLMKACIVFAVRILVLREWSNAFKFLQQLVRTF